ncbi:uncharacterized protein MELLADRAFT_113862 [Melampsora larici-populina 98AG31]|uniref:Uncharacterized protein n=1 Tax=Melampsora larici-populina (strain 98AG31 / pathotype 3-4-7) TaxID=747676 RepID=F4SB97_MELLP|nr:uncharacterized protein MELLADRAFT_113862 [Melampsora larici-populina 98AG31]EGF98081.1 hypothetical protein MELLADRAFT_113862 [Melampsora larici-populina 98AG31]
MSKTSVGVVTGLIVVKLDWSPKARMDPMGSNGVDANHGNDKLHKSFISAWGKWGESAVVRKGKIVGPRFGVRHKETPALRWTSEAREKNRTKSVISACLRVESLEAGSQGNLE